MGRFIFWTFVFLIVGGIIIHFNYNIPWVSGWIGKLPGDFCLKKGKLTICFPIVSAAVASFVFSLILYALFGKRKKKQD
jgi:hypothetical protein